MIEYYGYVYKISIPTSNGICIYIGQKRTHNNKIVENYWGGGKIINNWFMKYLNKSSSRCSKKLAEAIGIKRHIFKWCETKEELDALEIALIDLHLGKKYCWNITPGGFGGSYKGRKKTDEEKEKLRQAHLGKSLDYDVWNKGLKNCWSKETLEKIKLKKIGKPNPNIYKKCRNIDLNIEYPSCMHAAMSIQCKSIHVGLNGISRVCRGERKTAYGYRWEFIND